MKNKFFPIRINKFHNFTYDLTTNKYIKIIHSQTTAREKYKKYTYTIALSEDNYKILLLIMLSQKLFLKLTLGLIILQKTD